MENKSGGSKAVYKLYKKTGEMVRGAFPKEKGFNISIKIGLKIEILLLKIHLKIFLRKKSLEIILRKNMKLFRKFKKLS